MRFFYFLILALYLCVPLKKTDAAFFKPSQDFRTLKTDHFYIHYPVEAASVAEDAAEIAERVHDRLSEKLKWKPWGRTHMVLIDKTDSANGLATVLPANYLQLYISPPAADSSLDHYKNYLELLITHEYTHILHIDQHHRMADPPHWLFGKIIAPNGLTPGWMREGMAAWEETIETGRGRGNASYSDMILRASIYDDDFPAIDQAAGLGIHWPGSNSQYIYGVKFWQWLSEKYGEETIQRYMEEYSSGLWLFSLNNKARRVYNKSFYQLWKEWKGELEVRYSELKGVLENKGLTPFSVLLKNKDQLSYPIPHPSGTGYAYVQAGLDDSHRLVIDNEPDKDPIVIKRGSMGQMSFSRDGGSLFAFSSLSGIEPYNIYADVYVYDIAAKKLSRVYEKENSKKSLRATDPDFGPMDGGKRWLVMVRTELGTDNLYVYDYEEKKGYFLTSAPKYTQFSNPHFSPNGENIAVSRRDSDGNRDIVLYGKTGIELKNITANEASDNHPVWSPDGRFIYFESDSSGISNIYRYTVATGQTDPVTNVLTGVFHPQISPDGETLYVSSYTSSGWHLATADLGTKGSAFPSPNEVKTSRVVSRHHIKQSPLRRSYAGNTLSQGGLKPDMFYVSFLEGKEIEESDIDEEDIEEVEEKVSKKDKKNEEEIEDSVEEEEVENKAKDKDKKNKKSKEESNPESKTEHPSSYKDLLTGKSSPVQELSELSGSKKYSAFPQLLVPRYLVPTFSTLDDAIFLGFSTGRYDPLYRHFWTLYGNYRSDAQFVGAGGSYAYTRYFPSIYVGFSRYAINWGDIFAIGSDFFEQRLQGYTGVGFGFPHHSLSLSYFYEDRENLSDIPAGFALPNLDRYAGVRTQYVYSRYKGFADGISQENGPYLKLSFDITDSFLGAADVNEQRIFSGDFRYYFEMPWGDHHVFALRSAGGFAWGDAQFAGTFRFGGPFGEGNLAGYSDRLFPFRGLSGITFSGDRAMLFSAEYRLPIANIERGIGTWPIFFNKVHASFFGDYGDIWFNNGNAGQGFFDNFLLGVGAELKSDLVIGYGLPVTARLGYAIILLNRDQITGLEDSLTGMNLKNGTVYLQFGTAF